MAHLPALAGVPVFARDLAERVVTTFLAGFLGAVSLDWTNITSLGWKAWLVTGAVAGLLSVVKGLTARLIGDANTASLLSSLMSRSTKTVAPTAPTPEPPTGPAPTV
jgi:hypothetical protein